MTCAITPRAAIPDTAAKAYRARLSRRMRRKASPTKLSGNCRSVRGHNFPPPACLSPAGNSCRWQCTGSRHRKDSIPASDLPISPAYECNLFPIINRETSKSRTNYSNPVASTLPQFSIEHVMGMRANSIKRLALFIFKHSQIRVVP